MREELGIAAPTGPRPGELHGAELPARHDLLLSRRAGAPSLHLDRGELAAARWFARTALPADLGPYVLPVLAGALGVYSHSIVPGGLLVMSSTTRPTGRISLIIREAICSSRS